MVLGVAKRPQPDPSCRSCAALSERLDELEVIVRDLGAEVTRLKARKPTTSRTSSKPPSSDAPWSKGARRKKKPSGKKRGGQPGHKGQRRRPTPPEGVREAKAVKPGECRSCCEPLAGDDPSPQIHQVVDIPPVEPFVLEYLLHKLKCSRCGTSTRASLPEGVPQTSFGPNLSALIATLTGGYRMSPQRTTLHCRLLRHRHLAWRSLQGRGTDQRGARRGPRGRDGVCRRIGREAPR